MISLIQAGHDPLLRGLNLQKVATYAGIGACWSVVGFGNSRQKRGKEVEQFSLRKAGQTVLIGAIAGIIVASRDGDPTPANFEMAMAVAVPLSNQIINMVKRTASE